MKIAIVDDMPEEADVLEDCIKKWCADNFMPYQCDVFRDGSLFLDNSLSGDYDLVFLDIYMTVLDGIETARSIRDSNNNCNIIFLTSSTEHMPEAFSVHAYDYILKPAEYSRVSRVLSDLLKLRERDLQYLDIYVDKQKYRLAFGDIISIEADSNYCVVTSNMQYRTRASFNQLQKDLCADKRFLAINRGVLINMDYVRDMDNGVCTFKNGCILSLNSRKARSLKQAFIDYNFSMRHDRNDRGGRL